MRLDETCQEMVTLYREIRKDTRAYGRRVRGTFLRTRLAIQVLWDSKPQPYLPDQPTVNLLKVFDSQYID
jgi:hypothetical protein